jgi:hypothetical protein
MNYFKATHPRTIAESSRLELKKHKTVVRLIVGSKDFSRNLNRQLHEHLEELEIQHDFHLVNDVGHDAEALLKGLGEKNAKFYHQSLTPKSNLPDAEQSCEPEHAIRRCGN